MELSSAMSKEMASFAGDCVHRESVILYVQSLDLFFFFLVQTHITCMSMARGGKRTRERQEMNGTGDSAQKCP